MLTAKQEAFAVAYCESGNAHDAYLVAGYSAGVSDKTRYEAASRLLRNSKISARLQELRMAAAGSANVTLQSHLADLLWLREKAASDGKFSAAVTAEMARGKVVGLYIDRVAVSGGIEVTEKADLNALTTDELRAMYTMLLKAGVNATALT